MVTKILKHVARKAQFTRSTTAENTSLRSFIVKTIKFPKSSKPRIIIVVTPPTPGVECFEFGEFDAEYLRPGTRLLL